MTTLVRWRPAREIDSLPTELNRVFDGFFGGRGSGSGQTRRWVPAMDLAESEDNLVLTADLPGVGEDDVEIEIKDGVLTVAGERSDQNTKKTGGYQRVERAYGKFSRSLTLPDGIDAGKVEAEFDNGVLGITIPKPEERKPHRVAIAKGKIEGTASEKE
ncbi:MAG: Hsp20/alpha crystallin family protein [Solirubrobacterales bacterium]